MEELGSKLKSAQQPIKDLESILSQSAVWRKDAWKKVLQKLPKKKL